MDEAARGATLRESKMASAKLAEFEQLIKAHESAEFNANWEARLLADRVLGGWVPLEASKQAYRDARDQLEQIKKQVKNFWGNSNEQH